MNVGCGSQLCDACPPSAHAVAGSGIPSKYRGGGPAAVGGYKAQLFGDTAKIGAEIMQDEVDQCAPVPLFVDTWPCSYRCITRGVNLISSSAHGTCSACCSSARLEPIYAIAICTRSMHRISAPRVTSLDVSWTLLSPCVADDAAVAMCSVIFLRTALSSAAVAQPAINLNTAFEMAADAALGATLKPGFMPYRVIPAVVSPCTYAQHTRRTQSTLPAHDATAAWLCEQCAILTQTPVSLGAPNWSSTCLRMGDNRVCQQVSLTKLWAPGLQVCTSALGCLLTAAIALAARRTTWRS